jgi:hypothetical protein
MVEVECQVAGSRTSMPTITTSLGEAGTMRIPVGEGNTVHFSQAVKYLLTMG